MLNTSVIVSSMFETSQSLFWASFGLVDLMNFELTGIKNFTRFWAMLLFGSYSVINIIVLLNMLIAMMSNSYQIISVRLSFSTVVCSPAISHLNQLV
uniref:(California timema) hypothetical protein n=1 Tax=Timema californicum TaxID=61474 RepID=A0A7R9JLV8_TIMCA|nr:unnamed protein product [Timema californicum]